MTGGAQCATPLGQIGLMREAYVDTTSFEGRGKKGELKRLTMGEKRVSSTSAGRLSWARQPDNDNNTIERRPNILSEVG